MRTTGRRQDGRRRVTPRAATGYRSAPMRLRTLLLATLLTHGLAAPAAQAAPDQVSIIMDDDQFLYRGDQTASRSLAAARSLGAEAVRVTVLWRVVGEGARLSNKRDRAAEDRQAARQGARPAQALQARRPAHLPDAQLGPLRQPRQGRDPARHAGVLLDHRARAELRAPDRAAEPARERRHVQALPVALPRVRAGGRHALQRPLPRRERHPQGAAEGLAVVAVERAQPAGLAVAAVGERRARLAVRCTASSTTPATRACSSPATARTRSCSARRAPLGSPNRGARNGIRPVPFLREVACVAPNGQQYAGPAATARHCDDFARIGPLKATGVRAPPVHEEGRADGQARRAGDEITIANIGSLGTVLDSVSVAVRRQDPGGLPILLTEFGYESNPPDTAQRRSRCCARRSSTSSRSSSPTSTRASRRRRSSCCATRRR